jgi:hypothetical protein
VSITAKPVTASTSAWPAGALTTLGTIVIPKGDKGVACPAKSAGEVLQAVSTQRYGQTAKAAENFEVRS